MAGKQGFFKDLESIRQAVTTYGPQFLMGLGDAGEAIIRRVGQQGGLTQPAARQVRPPAARPIPTRAVESTQLRLPLTSRESGRFVSPYGPKIDPADIDARLAVQNRPSIMDVPAVPRRSVPVQGQTQMSVFSAPEPAFKTTPMQGPVSRTAQDLYANDPGTYRAIDELAQRASTYYGKPVTVDDLVSERGTLILQDLQRGQALAPRTPGGMIPRGPGGAVMEGTPGGRITQYQRGAMTKDMGDAGRAYQGEPIIDVDVREIQNAAGGLRTLDLKKIAALSALAGLGGVGLASRQGQPDFVPADRRSAIEGAFDREPDVDAYRSGRYIEENFPGTGAGSGMNQGAVAIGAGSIPIVTSRSRGRDEALNEALQNIQRPSGLTKQQADLARYYQEREAYAQHPTAKAQILADFAALGERYAQADMAAWASKNPELAYELTQKMKGKLPSQQMPQAQQIGAPTAEIGSDAGRTLAGNVDMAGQVAVTDAMANAGARDLQQATTPRMPVQIGNPGPYPVGTGNPGYNMYGYPLINPYN